LTHYRIDISYDGTDFAGWQSQAARAPRTVQGVIEEALKRLAGGVRVRVAGAGRTDAGVHALGQVASFQLPAPMAPAELQRALNGLLPSDVRVWAAASVPDAFHARRSAVSKLYRYVLDAGPAQGPTRRRQAGHVRCTLDATRLREAAALFLGRHDFASLASSGSSVKTSVRTVTRSETTLLAAREVEGSLPGGTTLIYEVAADGFLRRMVRSMVGGIVAVGRGALEAEDLRRALAARDRRAWPPPAQACGLTLVRVDYGAMLR
jgi:tRNA pseudouridine38-40 synthase